MKYIINYICMEKFNANKLKEYKRDFDDLRNLLNKTGDKVRNEILKLFNPEDYFQKTDEENTFFINFINECDTCILFTYQLENNQETKLFHIDYENQTYYEYDYLSYIGNKNNSDKWIILWKENF